MIRGVLLAGLIGCFAARAFGGPAEEAYRDGDLPRAEQLYQERLQAKPGDLRALYNLGNVRYRTEQIEEAERAYRRSLESPDPNLRARAAHNLGNIRLGTGDYPGAATAYREALRADPRADDSRYNLELALRLLEQPPPQQQPQDQSQGGDQEGEQEQNTQPDGDGGGEEATEETSPEDAPPPDPAGSPEEQSEEPEGDPQQEEGDPSDEATPPDAEREPGEYTRQQAERVLDGLAEEERRLQEERLQAESRNARVEKDW